MTNYVNGRDGLLRLLTLFAALAAYIIFLGLLVLIVYIVTRRLGDGYGSVDEEAAAAAAAAAAAGDELGASTSHDQTNPLAAGKEIWSCTYGSTSVYGDKYDFGDGKSSTKACSFDELYDGKLCVICYGDERNCFFVPCGHCATCNTCAIRIFNGENNVCPVCRHLIRKVGKIFVA